MSCKLLPERCQMNGRHPNNSVLFAVDDFLFYILRNLKKPVCACLPSRRAWLRWVVPPLVRCHNRFTADNFGQFRMCGRGERAARGGNCFIKQWIWTDNRLTLPLCPSYIAHWQTHFDLSGGVKAKLATRCCPRRSGGKRWVSQGSNWRARVICLAPTW